MVRTNKRNTNIVGADWKAQTVGHKRICLECLGQYKTENAILEKSGKLDDPSYLVGLEDSRFIDAHENVFVFSSHLASMEVLQMLSLFLSPSDIADVGQQMHHFVIGKMDVVENQLCHHHCYFPTIIGKGDETGLAVYAVHKKAEEIRQSRNKTD
jgi:hypothetical protein